MEKNRFADGCALILAGGDGTRLRFLTDKSLGGPRPKQFCALLGPEPLLTQTRHRVEHIIPRARTLVVVNQAHERFYAPLLRDAPSQSIVVQPANRGTAPAILYALMRASRQFDDGVVAVLPSDHYVSDDARFMSHVKAAFEAVDEECHTVALLGAPATAGDSGYGWIEPADLIGQSRLYRVRRFWEKPPASAAHELWQRGCLWNSFVMVSRISTLVSLIASALPDLHAAFDAIADSLGAPQEREVMEHLYREIEPVDFSERVLAFAEDRLAVLPLSGVHWSDIGDSQRLRNALERSKSAKVPTGAAAVTSRLLAGPILSQR